jgi:hypothetical protein
MRRQRSRARHQDSAAIFRGIFCSSCGVSRAPPRVHKGVPGLTAELASHRPRVFAKASCHGMWRILQLSRVACQFILVRSSIGGRKTRARTRHELGARGTQSMGVAAAERSAISAPASGVSEPGPSSFLAHAASWRASVLRCGIWASLDRQQGGPDHPRAPAPR